MQTGDDTYVPGKQSRLTETCRAWMVPGVNKSGA
uniref:Uncharacterized protein n=1 Tax=Arundo donax TaxID=35708 RepID=A0A0A8Y5S8_ARUDO